MVFIRERGYIGGPLEENCEKLAVEERFSKGESRRK